MKRNFVTVVAAAALALSGFGAAPAQARDHDAAKYIIGGLALGVIAAAIADSNKRDKRAVTRYRSNGYDNGYNNYNNGYRNGYNNGYRTNRNKHRNDNHGYRKTHRRHENHGSNRQHEYKHHHKNKNTYNEYNDGYRRDNGYTRPERLDRLPQACRVSHRGRNGVRYGYAGRCLSRRYAAYNQLPRRCAARVGGKFGTIYRDRCLRDYGYEVGRRH